MAPPPIPSISGRKEWIFACCLRGASLPKCPYGTIVANVYSLFNLPTQRSIASSLTAPTTESGLCPNWPASIGLGESGRLIVAQPKCLLTLDPDTGAFANFADLHGEPEHNRLNDGKVGPDGAFWVGSMDMRSNREKIGLLYRVP